MDARSLIQQDNDISDAICLGLQPKPRVLCALPHTFRLGSALYPDLPDFPNYVQKASFLTTTQTIPKSGVARASAAYSVTTAQPKKDAGSTFDRLLGPSGRNTESVSSCAGTSSAASPGISPGGIWNPEAADLSISSYRSHSFNTTLNCAFSSE
jgi:hypothetical protein